MRDLIKSTGQVPELPGNNNRGLDIVESDPQLIVTLENINESIIGYFKNSIIPTIDDNGIARPVPILYGDGEKWAQVRKEGSLRDPQSDKLLTPLIMLRRTSIKEGDISIPVNKYLVKTTGFEWDRRNVYDRFAMQNGIRPTRKIRTVMFPDYINVEYEGTMWTEYQSQMDKLIEQINVENYEFWGVDNTFKFKVTIEKFDSNTELPSDGNRVVITTFGMVVKAYLIPERAVENMKMASTAKTGYTYKRVIIEEKIVNSL